MIIMSVLCRLFAGSLSEEVAVEGAIVVSLSLWVVCLVALIFQKKLIYITANMGVQIVMI